MRHARESMSPEAMQRLSSSNGTRIIMSTWLKYQPHTAPSHLLSFQNSTGFTLQHRAKANQTRSWRCKFIRCSNADTNRSNYSVVGKIGGLSRSHGIAIAKDLGKGFISDGDSRLGGTVQQVVFFDLKTLKVTGKVSTGQPDTDAIIYEPVTKHVYTFNGDSHNSTVIDPEKQAVITTIDLVGKVEFPAVEDRKR